EMGAGNLSGFVRGLRHSLAPPAGETPDAELLGRFVERRDGDAFAALVGRHGPMVLGVCRRIVGDAHRAEDAFQAVFLVLARKARSWRSRGFVAGGLPGVAQRTASEARRAASVRRLKERRAAEMNPREATSDEPAPELRPLLDRELALLPENYRAAVVLC